MRLEEIFMEDMEEGLFANLSLNDKKKRVKEYTCTSTQCGLKLKTRKAFEEHMKLHDGCGKPFMCSLETCQKRFAQYSSLQKHERIHSGVKPYVCDYCNKAFSQLSNLKRHQNLHTGEKPYACELCDKVFSTDSNLKQHQQVHNDEELRSKFNCKRCDKAYLYQSSLSKHMRSHQKKDAKAELKKMKLAQKKNRRNKKIQQDIEFGVEPEREIPASVKFVKKEDEETDASSPSEHTTLIASKPESESNNDFLLKFGSFELNISEANTDKKRVSSFLEFFDEQVISHDGRSLENDKYQGFRRFGEETDRKERFNSKILNFLELDFFGESKYSIQNNRRRSLLGSIDYYDDLSYNQGSQIENNENYDYNQRQFENKFDPLYQSDSVNRSRNASYISFQKEEGYFSYF